jgi:aminomethyltransferase
MPEELKHTPLHDEHEALGAKMVPFAGYSMPVQYEGIRAEHLAVRTGAGLFDVSHMGEVEIRGPNAEACVQYLTTNDASKLEPGRAQYSTLLREDGGILDDLIVYRYDDRFMLVINAANREKDVAWIREHASRFDVAVEDRSDEIALIALQGPASPDIMAQLSDAPLDEIGYYRFAEGQVAGRSCTISRTGYTGEDGFELYLAAEDAVPVWHALLEAGRPNGLVPAGLGARDTLRLEMGYALYGNDLSEERTPLEAGLGWIVKLGKGDFIGREALVKRKEAGVTERLTGFRVPGRGFPRPGYAVRNGDDVVGVVTSGTVGPTVGDGIGLAYLPVELSEPGTEIEIEVRGRSMPAVVAKPPFHTAGTAGG